MDITFKKNTIISLVLTALFIGWSLIMYTTSVHEGLASDLYALYATMYLLAGIWGIIYSKKLGQGIISRSLKYWGISFVLYAIALYIQTYYVTFIGEEFYPSIADWFFLAHIVFLFIGSLLALKIYTQEITFRHIAGSILGIVVSGYVTYQYFGLPGFGVEDSSFLIDFFNSFYVLSGFLSMFLVILILTFAGGKIFKGLVYVVLGIATQTLADILFITRYENGTFWGGDIADVVYVISGLFFMLAIIYTTKGFLRNNTAMPIDKNK